MKIVIDMNLSPLWIAVFEQHGWIAVHWSDVENPTGADAEIMQWAAEGEWIVFTHDLDFGTLLAATNAHKPSVVQIRTQDVDPDHLESIVVSVITQYAELLEQGSLVTVDEARARVRLLPFRS